MKSIRSHSPGAGKNKTIRRNVIFILLVFLELFVVIGVGFQMLNKHHSDDIYVVTVMALVCVFITIIMTRIYSQYYNKILVQKNKELDDLAYKDAFPKEKAIQIIEEGSGTQFDPDLVPIFLDCIK